MTTAFMRALILGCAALALGSTTALADSRAPSIPTNVSAVSSGDSIQVQWDASSDDRGVVGYNVYRDGSYRVTVFDTRYTDYGVDRNRTYAYQITAYDEARNYTRGSERAQASLDGAAGAERTSSAGNERPATPDRPSATVQDDGAVSLSWAAANGAEGYNVYRDGRYVMTVRGTQWVDRTAESGGEHRYYLVSFSRGGRFSGKSEVVDIRGARGSLSGRSVPSDDGAGRGGDAPRGGAPDGYTLVFSEEFQGSSLDRSKWNTRYRWGPNWVINNESQYYVDTQGNPGFGHSPFSLDGEHLTISASRTPDSLRGAANSQGWLSGALTTYQHFAMTYGYVEMRAKMPRGKGMWPAFWLLHERNTERRPEIDVVELLGGDTDTVYQTYHWYENYSLRSTPSFRVQRADYADGFHTYGVRWEPGKVTWYVDGLETNRFSSDKVSSESMYLLLNLAVGGNWAGQPDGSTPDKVDYTIDYIRAYRR